MASNYQEFVTKVKLNTEEAQNKLEKLRKETETWIKKRDDLINNNGNKKEVNDLTKLINKNERAMAQLEKQTHNVIDTVNNLDGATLAQLTQTEKALNAEMRKTPQNTQYFHELTEKLQQVKTQIASIREQTKQNYTEQKQLNDEIQNMNNVLTYINTSSLKELSQAEATLKRQMQEAVPNSPDYTKAADSLRQVQTRIKQINAEQKEVVHTIDRYDEEIKRVNKDIAVTKRETDLINRTLKNLDKSSVRDIEYSIKILNENLKDIPQGTEKFKEANKQLKQLKSQLAAINKESEITGSRWSRMVGALNKNWGAITQVIAVFSGLSFTVRKCIADYAAMDQELVNVQKYTGQTKKEVEEMNETFKKMDTRTPREKLNQLAGDAGRLGIVAKDMVEEFVDGGDKINVALGDDLGDDAVKNIGKLAMMFGEDKTKGLRGAMLSTGSAVNELAQNSSASADYLVDFTARLAGVGIQAGLTQQQIMGYASVLDQNMQQDETAATALNNLITKMFQEPAKFAKIAGQNVKEFTTLLKTDANSALKQFLASMKEKGGFAELAPMFEEMHMDGSRATGVISVLADKLDDITTAQNLANKAYTEGKSVIDEFNTQMQSEQARLDMANKGFKELSIALGKELMPAGTLCISTAGMLVKSLFTVITFTKQNIATIIALTAAVVAVTAVYNANTIAKKLSAAWDSIIIAREKALTIAHKARIAVVTALKLAYYLLTGQMQKAKAAMDMMKAASLTNPYAALLTVVLALAAGIYKLVSYIIKQKEALKENAIEVRKLRAAQKDLKDAQDEASKSTAEERTRLEHLTKIINSNAYSYNEKKNAMLKLEKIVPGYHRNLKNEASLTAQNNRALKEYVARLNDAAMAQALYNKMVELQGQKFSLEQKIRKHENSRKAVQTEINRHPEYYNATTPQVFTTGYGQAMSGPNIPTEANRLKHDELQLWVNLTNEAKGNLKVIQSEIKNINDYMDRNKSVREAYDKIATGNSKQEFEPDTVNSGISGGGLSEKERKEQERQRKKEEAERRKEEAERRKRSAAKQKAFKNELKELESKNATEQAQNIWTYTQGKKLYSDYLKDQHDIAVEGYKAMIDIYKKYGQDYGEIEKKIAEENLKKEEDHTKSLLSEVEKRRMMEQIEAKTDYKTPGSDIYLKEQALNERLFEIDMSAMADRIAILKEGSQEWFAAKAEMEQKEIDHSIELQLQYSELLAQYREQWGQRDLDIQQRIELNGLDFLYEKKIIKEKEYQEMKKQIELEYAHMKSEQNLHDSPNETTKRNAHTAYETASNNAAAKEGNLSQTLGGYLTNDITHYRNTIEQLKLMYKEDYENNKEYQEAKKEATANMLEGVVSKTQAAYDSINNIMSAASSFYAAQSQYEQAVTTKKYDAMIEKAGSNTAKGKKLEEKKQKELAKIKSKYNKKQMKIEMAQAVASTAMAAINSYASASKEHWWLGAIAAAMATAAGMMQIATIKKQHAAEEAGYYEGGFTGGSSYRKKAGIVHEGEFVVNHDGVNNQNLMPVLRLFDQAQKNNTIGRLTATDVSRQLGQGNAAVVAPVLNVQNDSAAMSDTMNRVTDSVERLNRTIENGIPAHVHLDGNDGLMHRIKQYNRLQNNK